MILAASAAQVQISTPCFFSSSLSSHSLRNQSSYYIYGLTSTLPIPSLEQECPEEPQTEGEGSPTVPRAQLIEKQSVWRAVTTSLRATRASLSYQYFLWHVNHAFLPLFLICWQCLTLWARSKGLLSFASTINHESCPLPRCEDLRITLRQRDTERQS